MPNADVMQIKCPNCGASLDIHPDDDECHCEYCDQTMRVDVLMRDPKSIEMYRIWTEERLRRKQMQDKYELEKQRLEIDKERYIKIIKGESHNSIFFKGFRGCGVPIATLFGGFIGIIMVMADKKLAGWIVIAICVGLFIFNYIHD